jgi:hypothetical protein
VRCLLICGLLYLNIAWLCRLPCINFFQSSTCVTLLVAGSFLTLQEEGGTSISLTMRCFLICGVLCLNIAWLCRLPCVNLFRYSTCVTLLVTGSFLTLRREGEVGETYISLTMRCLLICVLSYLNSLALLLLLCQPFLLLCFAACLAVPLLCDLAGSFLTLLEPRRSFSLKTGILRENF